MYFLVSRVACPRHDHSGGAGGEGGGPTGCRIRAAAGVRVSVEMFVCGCLLCGTLMFLKKSHITTFGGYAFLEMHSPFR